MEHQNGENVETHQLVVDRPRPGFFLIRLGKNFPLVPCEIGLYSAKFSALTATICGDPASVVMVWNSACGRPIEKHHYCALIAQYEWDLQHDPDSPLANPRRPVDLNRLTVAF